MQCYRHFCDRATRAEKSPPLDCNPHGRHHGNPGRSLRSGLRWKQGGSGLLRFDALPVQLVVLCWVAGYDMALSR